MAERNADVPDAVRLAANHVGVSAAQRIVPADFMAALAGRPSTPEALAAVEVFLNEADPAEIADVVGCGAADFEGLAVLATRWLAPSHPNRLYLEHFAV